MDSGRWQRVEQLYHSALEQPPGDREAFLAAACERDADLKQRVEILLAQTCPTEVLIDKQAWQAATELTCSSASGFGAVNDFGELTNFLPACKRPCADTDESGDFFIRALHPIELFKFTDVNLHPRPRHSSLLLFE